MACAQWLAVDYLRRQGFTITASPGGRVAIRDRYTIRLPHECGHRDCLKTDERRAA